MPHRRRLIQSTQDVEAIRAEVLRSAERTRAWLSGFVGEPLGLLKAMKFEAIGTDPLTGEPLNLIEQLNQTFTVLVTLRAVERLLEWHPEAGGYQLALTTASGRDIESVEPDYVAAEVFAATHPARNQKLNKDMARLAQDPSIHRYVFFAAPAFSIGRQTKLERQAGVQVHCVEV